MARLKDLKAQNPEYVINLIDILAEKDPTKTNKYLPFMIKQTEEWLSWFKKELSDNTFKEMFDIVKEFEELTEKKLLDNKDIYSYESNQDIVDEIKFAREKVTKSQVKKFETEVLYEDDQWVVILPLTSRSSNMYGKATKWCIAADDQNYKKYYRDYTKEGMLVFLINKSVKDAECRDDKFSKVAFHQYLSKSGGLTVWDSKDAQLSLSDIMKVYATAPKEAIDTINGVLEGGVSNEQKALDKGIVIDKV